MTASSQCPAYMYLQRKRFVEDLTNCQDNAKENLK